MQPKPGSMLRTADGLQKLPAVDLSEGLLFPHCQRQAEVDSQLPDVDKGMRVCSLLVHRVQLNDCWEGHKGGKK